MARSPAGLSVRQNPGPLSWLPVPVEEFVGQDPGPGTVPYLMRTVILARRSPRRWSRTVAQAQEPGSRERLQGWQESNLRHPVLETGALAI